jgi:hypothetical protein
MNHTARRCMSPDGRPGDSGSIPMGFDEFMIPA